MKRGGAVKKGKKKAVKKRGGGMMEKMMGGGMMGPKKKMAKGGVAKKRGGGMMGPKKKMAKGGLAKALAEARFRKPSGRLNPDDVKRAMPTGRSAAAKKAAMKGTKGGKKAALMGSIIKGKGNPAGKDMSIAGKLRGAMGLLGRRKALGGRKPGRMGGGKKK